MAAKTRIPMGKLIPFPVRTLNAAAASTKIPGAVKHRLDEVTSEMIAAEQALFVALRLAQKSAANAGGDHPPIQPPPRTSSSRKKTAA
jgi:hypothetical protein